jgi:hypothetical protein
MMVLNASYVKIVSLMKNLMKHGFSAWNVQSSAFQSAADTVLVGTVILVTVA